MQILSIIAKPFLWISRNVKKLWKSIFPGIRAWKGAGWGMILSAIVLWIIGIISFNTPNSLWWVVPGLIFAGILVALIVGSLIWLLQNWISSWPSFYKWALFVTIVLSVSTLMFFSGNDLALLLGTAFIIITGSLLGASLTILMQKNWKSLHKSQRIILILGLVMGVGMVGFGTWWLIDPGMNGPEYHNAALENIENIVPLDLLDPSSHGPHNVQYMTYGTGEDIRRPEYGEGVDLTSRSVDASPFVQGWKGFSGWYLRQYWGFNLEKLPLNGRVWYPEGNGPFPLILVVHGNHLQEDFSDPGYDYLGELLASRGMIVVSVDENFLNGTWVSMFGAEESSNENDSRAWILLEHFRLWKSWNSEPGNPFYKKVDWDNLALIGHSRGGEAVAEAANFNRLPYYPDNAFIRFNYNYPIKAVIAIAPVDDQYNPANRETPLADVNYMVIQGSMDGDLTSYDGIGQFNRVQFTPGTNFFKGAVYVHGANHGQFNTTWGRIDTGTKMAGTFLNLEPILAPEDQEKISEVFISAFLEAALKDEKEYLRIFQDWRTGAHWLPETVYLTQYSDSKIIPIANFEEDIDTTTTTIEGGSIASLHLETWKEGYLFGKWQQQLSTSVVTLAWDNRNVNTPAASYAIRLPKDGVLLDEESMLVLNIADTGIDPDQNANEKRKNSPSKGIDFTIELQSDKVIVSLPLSWNQFLQHRLDVQILKADFMDDLPDGEPVMQTFIFPLSAFIEENPDFNPANLQTIRLRFDQSEAGTIVLDDIGFLQSR